MTWIEHPRIRQQKEDRLKLLARIQFENGWSREEMAEYFRQQAAEIADRTSPLVPPEHLVAEPESFNHFDQIAKHLKPQMQINPTVKQD